MRIFAGPDPFASVACLLPQPLVEGGSREMVLAIPSITPAPVTPKRSRSPLKSQVAESSKKALKRDASGSPLVPSQKIGAPRPGDGWYVAHNAAVPGVYYSV